MNKWEILNFFFLPNKIIFVGWGRKKSGLWASKLSKLTNNNVLLLEDGFIRSFGLGVEGSPSFSIVKDEIGIYYDATQPSKLENILNTYNFQNDTTLIQKAKDAISKILKYKISKYNNSKEINLDYLNTTKEKILIIAQTNNDSSLKYGLGNFFDTKKMINDAIIENPNAEIYIKIHPDVLIGAKKSDITIDEIPQNCHIIRENPNPIELIQYFNKFYTKTSGMGFEALLLNKEVYCYGMPFYAGWGITYDKLTCHRRKKSLTINEVFAGSYILYSNYYNPYSKEEVELLDVLEYIHNNK